MGALAPTNPFITMAQIHTRAYHYLRATGVNPNRGLTRLAHQPDTHQPRFVPLVVVDTENGEIIERKV